MNVVIRLPSVATSQICKTGKDFFQRLLFRNASTNISQIHLQIPRPSERNSRQKSLACGQSEGSQFEKTRNSNNHSIWSAKEKNMEKKHTFPASKKKTPNPKIQVQLTGWLCSRWMLVRSYRAQKLQNTILKEIPRSLFDFKATSNRAQLIFPDWFFKDTGLLKKTDQFSIMSYLLEKSTRWVRVRYRVLPRSPTGPVFSR